MLKFSLFLASLLLFFVLSVQGQGSCSCSNSNCSANQTCPDGYIAVCNCTATGCSSLCQPKGGGEGPEGRPGINSVSLQKADAATYGEILSKSLGRPVVFEPAANAKFDWADARLNTDSYWDVLELLSGKGNLTINGQKFDVWRTMHESLLKGESFNICFSEAPLSLILNHISFLSGKHFTVVEGDSRGNITGPLKGNGTADLIDKLSKMGNVVITEN